MKKQLDSKRVKFHRVPCGCELAIAFIDVLMGTELAHTDERFCSLMRGLSDYLDERYYLMEGRFYISSETVVFFGDDEGDVDEWSCCISEQLGKV